MWLPLGEHHLQNNYDVAIIIRSWINIVQCTLFRIFKIECLRITNHPEEIYHHNMFLPKHSYVIEPLPLLVFITEEKWYISYLTCYMLYFQAPYQPMDVSDPVFYLYDERLDCQCFPPNDMMISMGVRVSNDECSQTRGCDLHTTPCTYIQGPMRCRFRCACPQTTCTSVLIIVVYHGMHKTHSQQLCEIFLE